MPIPATWTTVPARWELYGQNGTPCVGRVRFSAEVTVAHDGASYVPEPFFANVVDGVMEAVELPATDDPDISPHEWLWKVQAQTTPAGPPAFYVQALVADAGGGIDLDTVVPVRYPTSSPQPAPSQIDGLTATNVDTPGTQTRTALEGLIADSVMDGGAP